MSLRKAVWLDCDCDGGACDACGGETCDSTVDSTLSVLGVAELRRRARVHGWKRVKTIGGAMLDLCPACADARKDGAK